MPRPRNRHYQTLGVPPTASAVEIRDAYWKLARQYHPDLNPGDKSAEESFKKLQEPYEVLSDPRKRQVYDQAEWYSEGGFTGTGPGATGVADPNQAASIRSFYRTVWMQEGVSETGRRDFYFPGFTEKSAATFSPGLKSFFADAAIGLLAMAVAIPAALHFGGFSYEGPWLIALPVTHFAAGLLFGYTDGNSWVKAARINFGYECYLLLWLTSSPPDWWEILPCVLVTFLPAVLGVFLRHRITKRMKGFPAKATV
jgi:hypothetical protein